MTNEIPSSNVQNPNRTHRRVVNSDQQFLGYWDLVIGRSLDIEILILGFTLTPNGDLLETTEALRIRPLPADRILTESNCLAEAERPMNR